MSELLIGVTKGVSKPSKVMVTLIELNTSPLVLPGAPERPAADPDAKFIMICMLPTPQGPMPILETGPTQEAVEAKFKRVLATTLQKMSVVCLTTLEVDIPGG